MNSTGTEKPGQTTIGVPRPHFFNTTIFFKPKRQLVSKVITSFHLDLSIAGFPGDRCCYLHFILFLCHSLLSYLGLHAPEKSLNFRGVLDSWKSLI